MAVEELDALAAGVLLPGFDGAVPPSWVRRRVAEGLGGVVLFARNVSDPRAVGALVATLRAERPDVLVAVDEEGGDVTRLQARAGSTHPGHLALGRVDDLSLTREVGRSIGATLREVGIDWALAPVADVASNPESPAIGVRSFGADPALVARHAAAFVQGLQADAGVIACAKHFPGHGATAVDSHLDLPVLDRSLEQLRAGELVPFRACVAAGVGSIMTAHLRVLAVDPASPATLSRAVVTDLLRGELGFGGVVVSDALEMAAVADFCGIGEAAVRALAAGVDALCLGGGHSDEQVVGTVQAAVVAAVREGRLPEARLADAAARTGSLATWGAGMVPDRRAPMSSSAGADAARRALLVSGAARLASGAPLVLTCDPDPMIAAGRVPWGVAPTLARVRPGTVPVRLGPADLTAIVVARAHDGPVVLVIRDGRRHPWQGEVERLLLAARPDAVVVDMGYPSPPAVATAGRITTFGASRAAACAAVAVLTGTPLEELA